MRIKLSDHFTVKKLLRFVLPSVFMMIFTSVYGVVDGLFISNIVGKTAFAAVNLILPVPMGIAAIGYMIGTGGSALVAKTLGEGKGEQANRYFSLFVYLTALCGVVVSVVGFIVLPAVAGVMKAEGQMLHDCVLYGRIIILAEAPFMLQYVFQSFFITAEKPKLGLFVTVAAGVTNIVLDALFVAIFRFGVAGAAIATACSQLVGGILPLFYFFRKNGSLLRLGKTKFDGRAIGRACLNGSSELMINLSLSVVNIAYNAQLMRLAGENGIAAYGVIMYVNFIFISIFLGYSIGVSPVIGFHYGGRNDSELRNLFKKSLVMIGIVGMTMFLAAMLLAPPLAKLFVGYDAGLYAMTCVAFRLYSISFLISGFNIFGSAFFTALNNGIVSAVISFSRTLLFQLASVLVLPLFLGLNGVWLSVTAAELLALAVTVFFFVTMRKRYRY